MLSPGKQQPVKGNVQQEEQKLDAGAESVTKSKLLFSRGLLVTSVSNAVMWTIWWLCYSLGENAADKSNGGWCAEPNGLCSFATLTLFVASGSVLGSSSIYLLQSRRDASCKEGLTNTVEGLLPDIAFIFTDYAASSISTGNNLSFPWLNVLVNFFGLGMVQAATTAMLERKCQLSQASFAIATGVSAALYTTAAALTQDTGLQPLSIFASTAGAPVLVEVTSRFFCKGKKEDTGDSMASGPSLSFV